MVVVGYRVIHIERVDGNHYFGPHFLDPRFFWILILLDLNFLDPKIVGPNFFWTHKLNGPKTIWTTIWIDLKCFWTHIFFGRIEGKLMCGSAQPSLFLSIYQLDSSPKVYFLTSSDPASVFIFSFPHPHPGKYRNLIFKVNVHTKPCPYHTRPNQENNITGRRPLGKKDLVRRRPHRKWPIRKTTS